MRQWNVNPKFLCRKHLLGEHVESHMFIGSIKKGISIKGYIEKGLVEVQNIKIRHDELEKEIISRKYNHNSPMDISEVLLWDAGYINSEQNINELKNRCKDCLERINKFNE